MTARILGLSMNGQPFAWLTHEQAICYAASGKVAWDLGDSEFVFCGGTSRRSGRRSEIRMKSIIAVSGSEIMAKHARQVIPLGDRNDLLFRRDRYTCCYCGNVLPASKLTRDHLVPRSRGGGDHWLNVASACRGCNQSKGAKLLSECPAHLQLLYLPYAPCRNEHFILSARGILVDQHEFLTLALPRHSRVLMS